METIHIKTVTRSIIKQLKTKQETPSILLNAMSVLLTNVSFFSSVTNTANPTNGTFLQIVTSQKLVEKHRSLIEEIRRTEDKQKRAALKINLPCFTPSGTFSHRAEKGLLKHSGLLQFDIDPKENLALNVDTAPAWREQISHLQQVAYCALSASGTGVWGVVIIEKPEHHQSYFEALKADLAGWGVVLDEKCGSVSHPRYWSFDPDAWINPNPVTYTKIKTTSPDVYTPRLQTPASTEDATKVDVVLKQIEANRTDITDGYDTWFSIGCALANAFGESGRDYFHRVSQNHPGYRNGDTDKQFSYCLRMQPTRITLGTFFEIARRHGIEYKGHLPRPIENFITVATPRTPCLPTQSVLPAGYRRERYTDQSTGRISDVLVNADGYPASWDLPDNQRESLGQLIRNNPEVTELIGRFDMQLEGVEKLTDESERKWEQSKLHGQQIMERANGILHYKESKRQPGKSGKRYR